MNTQLALQLASDALHKLEGKRFNILDISKPTSSDGILNLVKFNSKLSPLIANLIEVDVCSFLNQQGNFNHLGTWIRQDPGFPDVILNSTIFPQPGFEIKAWFPLATEMTARFKDSQNAFLDNQTNVAVIAWLPEFLIYGQPKVVGVFITSAKSIAKARDIHYFNPPDYLVVEPLDTKMRTKNLQQSNTSGYKWQSNNKEQFLNAERIVIEQLDSEELYSATEKQKNLVNLLLQNYPYRLDTNYAKLDRIKHPDLDKFILEIYTRKIYGRSIRDWYRLFQSDNEKLMLDSLSEISEPW